MYIYSTASARIRRRAIDLHLIPQLIFSACVVPHLYNMGDVVDSRMRAGSEKKGARYRKKRRIEEQGHTNKQGHVTIVWVRASENF